MDRCMSSPIDRYRNASPDWCESGGARTQLSRYSAQRFLYSSLATEYILLSGKTDNEDGESQERG